MSKLEKRIDRIADHMAEKIFNGMLVELDKEVKETLQKNPTTEAEATAHILRGLISYHERMTMGNYPERDFYLNALHFALACVEEKIEC